MCLSWCIISLHAKYIPTIFFKKPLRWDFIEAVLKIKKIKLLVCFVIYLEMELSKSRVRTCSLIWVLQHNFKWVISGTNLHSTIYLFIYLRESTYEYIRKTQTPFLWMFLLIECHNSVSLHCASWLGNPPILTPSSLFLASRICECSKHSFQLR